jgi:hypothetical protein
MQLMWKCSILSIVILASDAAAQSTTGRPQVMSVCEVLADFERIGDTPVVIVGRMESSVSLIDHYEYLSEDRCEHPVVTHGHTWKTKILIWTGSEEGMPKAPSDNPKLEPTQLAAKLSVVRRNTELGTHTEPVFNRSSHQVITKIVPNEWASVYGLLVKSPGLDDNCDSDDCRGSDIPLLIIADPRAVHTLK